ncbi:unnamed protein product [Brassica rapa subsp. trilocularis]
MIGLNPRVANSPSFFLLILLNPNRFEGSEIWSIREMLADGVDSGVSFPLFSLGLQAYYAEVRKVQLGRVFSEQLRQII